MCVCVCVYHCIKVVIKIFRVDCNKSFFVAQTYYPIFIITFGINYSNDSNVIAMIFIFFIAINFFSHSVYISSFDFLKKKIKIQVPFLPMADTY